MARGSWCSAMFCKTFFAAVLFQCCCGINSLEEMKQQTFAPSAEREIYPNMDESLEFNDIEPQYLDSDILFSTDSGVINDILPNELLMEKESDELTPLINRKKRSVSEEESTDDKAAPGYHQERQRDLIKSNWNGNSENEFLKTDKRKARGKALFIPRIGKKSYESRENVEQKRVIFIPRIGKKSSDDLNYSHEKRVVFIPRIGKKSITDTDEIFEAKRAIFIPRIGRGSYFLPKVAPYNPQYKATRRVVFIPRIG